MSETKKLSSIEPLQRADGKLSETTRSPQDAKVVEPLPADRRSTLEADIAKFIAEFTGDES